MRYNREFKKDLDKNRALRDTIRSVGRPIIFTTITISLGFSILLFSHFEPTAVFGMLMIITMVSALVADMILLPSLMTHVELITIWDLLKVKLGKDPQKGIRLFSGLAPGVKSAKSLTLAPRRPGDVGLYFRIPIGMSDFG